MFSWTKFSVTRVKIFEKLGAHGISSPIGQCYFYAFTSFLLKTLYFNLNSRYHFHTSHCSADDPVPLGEPCSWGADCATLYSACLPPPSTREETFTCQCKKNYDQVEDYCIPSEYKYACQCKPLFHTGWKLLYPKGVWMYSKGVWVHVIITMCIRQVTNYYISRKWQCPMPTQTMLITDRRLLYFTGAPNTQ